MATKVKRTKIKTKKAAAKRFKITKTGKILRSLAYHKHNMGKRSKRSLRNQGGMQVIDKTDYKRILSCLQGIL
jgi:large subunit ribosomal protein L35